MSNIAGPIMDIVRPYLVSVKRSGSRNAVACCPFHKDSKPSFAINTENGLWICYACGQKGNIRSFLRRVGKSEEVIDATVAPIKDDLEYYNRLSKAKESARYTTDPFLGPYILPEAVLGMFDFMPVGLVNAGFDPVVLREYGVGYDNRQDRIIFPIRDLYGNLVGVSGRATAKGDEPRYKIYKAGRLDGKSRVAGDYGEGFDAVYPDYDIGKGMYLWNADRVYPEAMSPKSRSVIIVEGFKACLWMIQNGFDNTVALMGSSASRNQLDLIMRMAGNKIILFLDNDTAGAEGTARLYKVLSLSAPDLAIALYPDWASQPDDMKLNALAKAVSGARRWREHVRLQRVHGLR